MGNRIYFVIISFLFVLTFLSCNQKEKIVEQITLVRPEIGTVYTKVYRLIEYGEYNLAFSELAHYLRFYPPEERNSFDIQNLFAKYIIEGNDTFENMIDNYVKLFDFFSSSDAEAVYQMLIYRSANDSDIERLTLIVASKADDGNSDAGLYFFLSYTFYNLKMREQAEKYLDCLISIAPQHPATAYLFFRIRGKKPNFRAQAVEALRILFYRDKSLSAMGTIASNFHIPSMINREWGEIAHKLLKSRVFNVRLIAYSEIPIFFARNNDSEVLYNLLKSQILENNYKLFSLAMRSLLYVFKEPHTVVNRLRSEFGDHPFVLMLHAKYLASISLYNLRDITQLCINALEKDNNIEIFFDSVEILRNTSEIFKLKSFAEELLFKYPYYPELYNTYKLVSSNSDIGGVFERYFEHIPESVEKYLILSYVQDDLKSKKESILSGLKIYKGDCRLVIELLNIESRCDAGDFIKNYNEQFKKYILKNEMLRCINKLEDEKQAVYMSLVKYGRREMCTERGK